MSGQAYREMALAEMANSTTFFGNANLERARRLALLPETTDEAEASGMQPCGPVPDETCLAMLLNLSLTIWETYKFMALKNRDLNKTAKQASY